RDGGAGCLRIRLVVLLVFIERLEQGDGTRIILFENLQMDGAEGAAHAAEEAGGVVAGHEDTDPLDLQTVLRQLGFHRIVKHRQRDDLVGHRALQPSRDGMHAIRNQYIISKSPPAERKDRCPSRFPKTPNRAAAGGAGWWCSPCSPARWRSAGCCMRKGNS